MILVTGASGAVGSKLVERLVADGVTPVPAGRRPDALRSRWPDLSPVEIDVVRPDSLTASLEGIRLAYYLIHSMEPGVDDFQERDRVGAENFASAARATGVERVVYLGGLGGEGGKVSSHLASRHEVGQVLAAHGPPLIEFRAAMVVDTESASFRMLRDLVRRLPAMIVPRWVDTLSQPISIDDVVSYLTAAISVGTDQHHTIVQIGGPEQVTYRDMLRTYAALTGRNRPILGVPFLTPRLSSLWCGLTTSVPSSLARPLIDGLSTPMIVRDDAAARMFPSIHPAPFSEAIARILEREGSRA